MATTRGWTFLLEPRDPIVVRDARPFSADPGARAVTLDWPFPQTVAGALRTHIGNALGFDWRTTGPERARKIAVRGPFLVARRAGQSAWTVYFPAPLDAILYRKEGDLKALCLRPLESLVEGGGCDLPHANLVPMGPTVPEDFKAESRCSFWSLPDTAAWLTQPQSSRPPQDGLPSVPRDTRVHVSIRSATQTSLEGALFSTTALAFGQAGADNPDGAWETAMICRVEAAPDGWQPRAGFLPLGGERRPVAVAPVDRGWPEPVVEALARAAGLRLQLATPAIFRHGWRPDWLDERTLEGTPPGHPNVKLRLVGAAVGRPVAVSGWDFQTRRPKATRYAAPAGSVYFFRLAGGPGEQQLRDLWLQPVSDDEQDRLDGFGLALPGIW